jgi:hypothetical protein
MLSSPATRAAKLTTLPAELLNQIITKVSESDQFAFLCTCKLLHRLIQPILASKKIIWHRTLQGLISRIAILPWAHAPHQPYGKPPRNALQQVIQFSHTLSKPSSLNEERHYLPKNEQLRDLKCICVPWKSIDQNPPFNSQRPLGPFQAVDDASPNQLPLYETIHLEGSMNSTQDWMTMESKLLEDLILLDRVCSVVFQHCTPKLTSITWMAMNQEHRMSSTLSNSFALYPTTSSMMGTIVPAPPWADRAVDIILRHALPLSQFCARSMFPSHTLIHSGLDPLTRSKPYLASLNSMELVPPHPIPPEMIGTMLADIAPNLRQLILDIPKINPDHLTALLSLRSLQKLSIVSVLSSRALQANPSPATTPISSPSINKVKLTLKSLSINIRSSTRLCGIASRHISWFLSHVRTSHLRIIGPLDSAMTPHGPYVLPQVTNPVDNLCLENIQYLNVRLPHKKSPSLFCAMKLDFY